jgi:phenylpropionate dioxygenase-like ring-hydroxylating dioxygenase large terminal subunit
MLSKEQNDLITLTGKGTPGGAMMRRYWQPVALSAEVPADAPLAVRLLGEDLVVFRDGAGAPQLIHRFCPHRKVDLSYGRVEDGGLRCIYHGWLLSGDGRCLEQPGEPADSSYKDRIRQTAYPCREAGGLILAYLGPGEPPRLPRFPFIAGDRDDQVWASKLHHDCNWLQAHEGNADPQHISFLHRSFSAAESLLPTRNTFYGADVAPKMEVEETGYGLRIVTARALEGGRNYLRLTHHIMPNASTFAGLPCVDPAVQPDYENLSYQLHWHVPIDDGQHWKYTLIYRHDGAVDKDFLDNRLFVDMARTHHSQRTAENRYLQDREEMKRATFLGIGKNFFDHDKLAVESQGRIMDRTDEHLGTTDRPVVLMRRQLLRAVAEVAADRDPQFVERGGAPDALAEMVVRSQVLPASVDPRGDWWRQPIP